MMASVAMAARVEGVAATAPEPEVPPTSEPTIPVAEVTAPTGADDTPARLDFSPTCGGKLPAADVAADALILLGGGPWGSAGERDLPTLADQLNYLERHLRAAQGTNVGVCANFTSFFDSALLAVGTTDALYRIYDDRPFIERLMEIGRAHV